MKRLGEAFPMPDVPPVIKIVLECIFMKVPL